ncbi:MAG TPA: hypothetical protein VII52_06490, partial [Gemmatimonadaceae bacterium]
METVRMKARDHTRLPVAGPHQTGAPAGIGRGSARWRFLAEASLALEASLDYQATLSNVVRLAIPAVADYAAIALRAAYGRSYWAANAFHDATRPWLP